MSTTTRKKTPLYQDMDGFTMPRQFSRDAFRSALAYKPTPEDVFVVTFPKCGTTWVQMIVGLIFRKGKPFSSAMEFFEMAPFLEMNGAEAAVNMKRPGAFKIHLPFHLAPYSPDAKYIFVARNPKDCCVSFYHHTENMPLYGFENGEFDDYFEIFYEGKTDFGDYFNSLISWYNHRNDTNVLFITYEQLHEDIKSMVLKIAEFLGPQYKETLEKDEQMLKDVMHYSSFEYMKEHLNKHFAELAAIPKEAYLSNPNIPQSVRELFGGELSVFNDADKVHFVRKGIVGDWKNYFSSMQNARLMKKFREKTIGTDILNLWEKYM